MIKTTITISRQMGAGGSYIGQLVAKRLGLKYIDREVLSLAAREFGCDEETVLARSERITSFWERVLGAYRSARLTLITIRRRWETFPIANSSRNKLRFSNASPARKTVW